MLRLFKRKPKQPKRLKDYLNMEFKIALNKPEPAHLTWFKKHLDTKFETDLADSTRSIFHIAIHRAL